MNTENLRHLVALADTGSFTEAAARSGVTQPAVSLAARKMERDLGVKLFERVGNRFVPTPAGKIMLEHAREMLSAEDRLLSSLARSTDVASGVLRVAASNIPGEYVLPLLLGEFRGTHPDIEPMLEVTDSARVEEMVICEAVEVGSVGAVHAEGLEATPYCPDTLKVVCHPAHPMAGKKGVKPAALIKEKFILREEGSGTRELMLSALSGAGLDVSRLTVEMELGSTGSVISSVEAGAGISMVSQWAVNGPIAEGALGEIKVAGLKATRQFSLIRIAGRDLSPQAASLFSFILAKKAFLKKRAAA
ncbi:MAG: LysR family transcriptional regulator [Actinomycetota bacterium]